MHLEKMSDKIKTVTLWEPREDVDGGGRMDRGMGVYYLSRETAGEISQKNWGGTPNERTALEVGGKLYLLELTKPIKIADDPAVLAKQELRKKTLAKLSPEEKEALGLKEKE